MSELSFEQMLDESFKTIRNGEVLEGTVIGAKPEELILNIGYKADGILTSQEYSNEPVDMTTVASVGDTMTVKVLKVNDGEGQVLLTYKRLLAEKGNERLREAYENREVLKAPVTQVLGGGLCVEVENARVFIPASLVSDSFERDLSKYAGQEIEFVVTEFNPRRNRVIGDRRQLMAAERAEKQRELFARLQVGDRIDGVVKNVTDFGAFVDLGGADGLLHISEMSWGHVDSPKKLFSVGDQVTVMVKDIKDTKVALTLKFPETNPWTNAAEKFAVGSVVEGKVARMTSFGAFVELAPGIDALLHVSQIAREHVEKPSDVLSVGQMVTAKIVDFNEIERKISLSMKALLPEAEKPEEAAEAETEAPKAEPEETAKAETEAPKAEPEEAAKAETEASKAEAEETAEAETEAPKAEPEATKEAEAANEAEEETVQEAVEEAAREVAEEAPAADKEPDSTPE